MIAAEGMQARGPRAAADMIIELPRGEIVLVRRKYPPPGWAIPGGFIEEGESAEQAAVREAREETGLDVTLTELLHVYSDPHRDPRRQTIGIVFIGRAAGVPLGGDDAAEARAFTHAELPDDMAFDHADVLADYFHYKRTGERPRPHLSRPGSLADAEKRALLAAARSAIRAALDGDVPATSGVAEAGCRGGAFVSLYLDGELRGCVGTLAGGLPLGRLIREMAVAAALDDPRFPALSTDELARVRIGISLLSRPIRASAEHVIPGVHGVSIVHGDRRGVYLPQVASEAGWDRETLLAETCKKAGLAATAWRTVDVSISVFCAESFHEPD